MIFQSTQITFHCKVPWSSATLMLWWKFGDYFTCWDGDVKCRGSDRFSNNTDIWDQSWNILVLITKAMAHVTSDCLTFARWWKKQSNKWRKGLEQGWLRARRKWERPGIPGAYLTPGWSCHLQQSVCIWLAPLTVKLAQVEIFYSHLHALCESMKASVDILIQCLCVHLKHRWHYSYFWRIIRAS